VGGFFLIALGIIVAIRMLNIDLIGGVTRSEATPAPEMTTTIAFAVNDIVAGTVLSAEDVTMTDIPIEYAPRDAITSPDEAIGRILKTDLYSGEMILLHNLANPTGQTFDIAWILDDQHVLMALPATDLISREAMVKRGDIVDILVTYQDVLNPVTPGETTTAETEEANKKKQSVTFDAMQRLGITALVVDIVQDEQNNNPAQTEGENPNPQRDQMVVQAYLVALNPQDALILKYLKDNDATFDFVLRAPTSTGQFPLTPVTAEFIKELYGLELLP
jgi:pilus assembly protein CpaB